jgi:hypothetical protein
MRRRATSYNFQDVAARFLQDIHSVDKGKVGKCQMKSHARPVTSNRFICDETIVRGVYNDFNEIPWIVKIMVRKLARRC